MDKEEFFRQWAVDGMPADKIRLANTAWDEATKAEREACAKVCDALCVGDFSEADRGRIQCAKAIEARTL